MSTTEVATGPDTTSGPVGPPAARTAPAKRIRPRRRPATGLGVGFAVTYLSLVVLIPLAVLVYHGTSGGWSQFWSDISTPDALAALKLTVLASLAVAVINVVMGTLIAWVLVRDSFPGKGVLDALIDLPFALPTIVAGLVLLVLYGDKSPLGLHLAYKQISVVIALLFVTLPFVVRTVQPVLLELDRDMEQAAYSLGAGPATTFRRIVLPNLVPAMLSGGGLAFTRAIAEYGATNLFTGNIPLKTQVAAVNIYARIENDQQGAAAAISVALLVIAFVVLLTLDAVQRWGVRRG
jgi:sulfate/thiosulfate transport system permease protein